MPAEIYDRNIYQNKNLLKNIPNALAYNSNA
jgi:hypothetical protein